MHGYRRSDGLFDIEGQVIDTKPFDFRPVGAEATAPAGTHLHDLWVRLVVDDQLVVQEVIAAADATPFPVCREAAATLARLKGARIAPGWSAAVKESLGGVKSCTHLMELMLPLATAAYQALATARATRPEPIAPSGRPARIDGCYAFASHREVVRRKWPEHYTGDRFP